MRHLNKNKVFLIICIAALAVLIILKWRVIHTKWIEVFRQDFTFVDYNAVGNPEGQILMYKAGKIYVIGNVVNGVKHGWETMFYPSGRIESKTYFVKGSPSGKGYIYDSNGKLKYSGFYFNGKPYGGWYEYFPTGKPRKFYLYDINKKIEFSLDYLYDGKIRSKSMSGLVVSPILFSKDIETDSLIQMDYDSNPDRKFSNIRGLYVVVANARHSRLSVKIKINQRDYKIDSVKSSTIYIPNAFLEKGIYDIFIESQLFDVNDKVINGINIKDSIIKE
jgi:hypothetical protein